MLTQTQGEETYLSLLNLELLKSKQTQGNLPKFLLTILSNILHSAHQIVAGEITGEGDQKNGEILDERMAKILKHRRDSLEQKTLYPQLGRLDVWEMGFTISRKKYS